MSKQDVKRYIEYEAPGMGLVDNDVAAVVCHRRGCDERVTVDPATLVPEDADAVDVEAKDPETADTYKIEIYCCPECRNDQYSGGVPV